MEPFDNRLSALKWRLAVARFQAAAGSLALTLRAGYRPDQPRAPRGQSDGGQWVRGPRGAQVHRVSRRRSGGGQVRINGRWRPVSPAQEVLLAQSAAARDQAIRAVRRVDPKWKAPPQAYETVEGLISANRAVEHAARFRIYELSGTHVGPGPYASEWIPAPPTNRRLNRAEQREIDRIGRENGCRRCGKQESGTRRGSFIGDHQVPKSMGTPTRIYPHCATCSSSQGGLMRPYLKEPSE